MNDDFLVSVRIKLINEVSRQLGLISGEFEMIHRKANMFSESLSKASSIAGTLTKVTFGLGAPLVYAVSKAAELQKQMLGVQIATHATTDQMDSLRDIVEKAAVGTMFNVNQVADMAKIIATSNSFNEPQVASMLPSYARFADAQLLLKGTDYTTSVTEANKLAHTAKIYDPTGMAKYLDILTKASIVMPDKLPQLASALKYSQGMAQTGLGVDPETMVLMTALVDRLGFGGSRGGTNLIAAMTRTIPGIFGSGLLKGKSNEALRAMGLTDAHGHSLIMTNGKFDPMKWMEGLSAYVSREFSKNSPAIARQHILTNMQHAFGTQGSRIATLLSDPQALKQLLLIQQQFEQLAGNDAIQDIFVKKSVSQQYYSALKQFNNVFMEFGVQLLPLAAASLREVNKVLAAVVPWMKEHKQLVKEIGESLVAFVVGLAVVGGVLFVYANFAWIAIAAGIAAVGVAIVHFWDQIKSVLAELNPSALYNKASNAVSGGLHNTADWLKSVFDPYKRNPYHDAMTAPSGHTTVTVYNQIDGRTIGKTVAKVQGKAASAPSSTPTYHDPYNTMISPAYNGAS